MIAVQRLDRVIVEDVDWIFYGVEVAIDGGRLAPSGVGRNVRGVERVVELYDRMRE